jgi:hypothetical protein
MELVVCFLCITGGQAALDVKHFHEIRNVCHIPYIGTGNAAVCVVIDVSYLKPSNRTVTSVSVDGQQSAVKSGH